MKIGIIGAGHIGSALTHRLTELGHDVAVANSRGPETLRELADVTGARAVPAGEAADGAEIVVVTIPARSVPDLPDDLLDGAAPDAVVVDTNNYYPQQRDGRIDAIEGGMPESAWTAQQIGRPVVKVFNTIQAAHIRTHGRPAGDPQRIALPVAGDDGAGKARVMQLVDELGFDPVDAGGLDESWRQQPGTPAYGADLGADALRDALAAASPDRPAEFRA